MPAVSAAARRIFRTRRLALLGVLLLPAPAAAQAFDAVRASSCGVPASALTASVPDSTGVERTIVRLTAGSGSDREDALLAHALSVLVAEQVRHSASIDVRARASGTALATNDVQSAIAEGRVLGVRYLLVGTVAQRADSAFVNWRVVDTRSGAQRTSGRLALRGDAAGQLVATLAGAVGSLYDRPATTSAPYERLATRSRTALDAYIGALYDLESFDPERLRRADSLLTVALAADPRFVDAHHRRARLRLRLLETGAQSPSLRAQWTREGLLAAARVLHVAPYDARALALLGRLHIASNTPLLARPIVRALREMNAVDAGLLEIAILRATGRDSEALRLARRQVGATELEVDAWLLRADLERRVGDVKSACQALNRVVVLEPWLAPAYVWRGVVRASLGERREAWADAEVAARLGRTAWGELAGALIDAGVGDSVRARTRLRAVSASDGPEQVDWLGLLLQSAVAMRLGDGAAARDALVRMSCDEPRRVGIAREPLLRYLRVPDGCREPVGALSATGV